MRVAPRRAGPTIRRGESRQDLETPPDFMQAVENRFGRIDFDLAANALNRKADRWYGPGSSEGVDSLVHEWATIANDRVAPDRMQNLWLNPPFGTTAAWIRKAHEDYAATPLLKRTSRRLLLLCQASVGSNYWRDHCRHAPCLSLFLNGRIQFVGETHGFPKDLMLLVWGEFNGIDCWRWKDDI